MKYILSLKSQNYQIHSYFRQIKDLISMTDNNLLDSPETNKSLSTANDTIDSNEEKPFFAQGIFSYKDQGTNGVIDPV